MSTSTSMNAGAGGGGAELVKRRLENHILEVLSELLAREVRDPRVEDVVITAVELNEDFSVAKVFTMGGGPTALRGLRQAAGFLRGGLGRTLKTKTAPELRFREDRSLEQYNRVEALLEEDRPAAGGEEAAAEDGEA
ncbi:30S ribosome-binding factor RbfA [bacterium]|nr:30S ribosome-binding factor RbfA [bacterium]